MPYPEAAITRKREGMAVMDEPVTEGKAVMRREPMTERKTVTVESEPMVVERGPMVDAGARRECAA
jgi:hypothetical protein